MSREILHGGAIRRSLLAPTIPPDPGLFGLCLDCLWFLNNLVVRWMDKFEIHAVYNGHC